MQFVQKNIIQILLLILLCGTLLNSTAFGEITLISLFAFLIIGGFVAALIFLLLNINQKKTIKLYIPTSTLFIILLNVYFLLQGYFLGKYNMFHLYFVIAALLSLSLALFKQSPDLIISKIGMTNSFSLLHVGIVVISLLESVVVLLQYFKKFPVPSSQFSCTGTWANPNVTAMFLTMSLFSFQILYNKALKKYLKSITIILVFIIVFAIFFLYCRTAYLALCFIGLSWIVRVFNINFSQKIKIVLPILVILIGLISFTFKKQSSIGRIQIWSNSYVLIKEKPIFGYGLGSFEKIYNETIATGHLVSAGHINMAFNDFVEILFQGGILALLFWIGYLGFCFQNCCSGSLLHPFFPWYVGFIIFQGTNFCYQAIPVFTLYVVYSSLLSDNFSIKKYYDILLNTKIKMFVLFGVLIFSISILICCYNLAAAFYNKWLFSNKPKELSILTEMEKLNPVLDQYSSYHELNGDILFKNKYFKQATYQYKQALNYSSVPALWHKTGISYQMLKQYDSSLYFFTGAKRLMPGKLLPQYYLLRLFEEKMDTVKILSKAKIMINTPAKHTKTNDDIKQYAQNVYRYYKQFK